MEFIAFQSAALASVVGGYGAMFILAGVITYLVTAYFGYIGQKTIYRVNALSLDIDRVKNQFEGNSKDLNRALLDLYTSRGINVSGFIAGFVPIVLLALCAVTLALVMADGFSQIHSVLLPWIEDLAAPDPLYILPVTLGAIYWIQRRLNLRFNPARGSESKRFITNGIPIFALVVSAILPSGVALYWLTYAALSATQQYVVFQHVLSV